MRSRLGLTSIIVLALVFKVQSQQATLTEISRVRPHQIKSEGFQLRKSQEIQIEGVALRRSRYKRMTFTRAWILDAETRKVVWKLRDASTDKRGRWLVRFEDQVSLPAGNYEVYYAAYPYHFDKGWHGFGSWVDQVIDDVFDDREYEDLDHAYKREWHEFGIVVKGDGRRFGEREMDALRRPFLKKCFVSIKHLHDDSRQRQAFELKKDMNVEVYAIGEARSDGTFDYGWIVDTEKHKRVWKFTYRNSEHAGGAEKNRKIRQTLMLPNGKYAAFFVTDDSHSNFEWNAAPPDDPEMWGLTLRVVNDSELQYVKSYEYSDFDEKDVIFKFTGLQDNEFHCKRFRCNKDTEVRIYAIGEGERSEMFDYSWIIDLKAHRKVWEMNYFNTEHAGGGEKNRIFDGIIRLRKGDYALYCMTDDSHNYWDWNTTPPFDQKNWGVTVLAGGDNFDPKAIADLDAGEKKGVIAQIIRVGDDERQRERFAIRKDSRVRVYAIGEGRRGRMYDYGWIENAETDEVVWEMTFQDTRHAGGSKKNRVVDEAIHLDAGHYWLYYTSDDSHSFGSWNSAPPYDANYWGITVFETDK